MAVHRPQTGLKALTDGTQVRRVEHAGEPLYSAVDVVAALADTFDANQFWTDLKVREPRLADVVEHAEFGDAVRLDGLLRLIQSIPSAKAERIKLWLARSARERLEEAENPELAAVRTRKLYENKGYSPRWVDKRLRGVSARHELTGEWFKRGATESEQYRALTNDMMQSAFGMDVETLRRHKSLARPAENLRDHMTDLELALTALAETVAVNLHRTRGSLGFEKLAADAKDAGEIVAETRRAIESRSGQPVLTAGNPRSWWRPVRPRRGSDPGKAVA
jgi:DNA-damage-inducible protein D